MKKKRIIIFILMILVVFFFVMDTRVEVQADTYNQSLIATGFENIVDVQEGDLLHNGRHQYVVLEQDAVSVVTDDVEGTYQRSEIDTFSFGIKMAILDVDRNGLDDIVVLGAGSTATSGFFKIYFNQSTSSINFSLYDVSLSLGDPTDFTVGDFNQDGYDDFIITQNYSNRISMFKANSYQDYSEIYVEEFIEHTTTIETVDMNHDYKLDFIVGCSNSNQLNLYTNQGDNSFVDSQITLPDTPANAYIKDIIYEDMNEDYIKDVNVIVTDSANGTYTDILSIYTDSNGSIFDIYKVVNHAPFMVDVMLDDANSDGNMDIIVASQDNVELMLKIRDDYQFNIENNINQGVPLVGSIAQTDFNDDGAMDFIYSSSGNALYVTEADYTVDVVFESLYGDYVDQSVSTLVENEVMLDQSLDFSGRTDVMVEYGDVDYDGDIDLLVGERTGTTSGQLSWYENNQESGYQQHLISEEAITAIKLDDINYDGWLDVVYATPYQLNMAFNNDTQTFTSFNIDYISQINDIDTGVISQSMVKTIFTSSGESTSYVDAYTYQSGQSFEHSILASGTDFLSINTFDLGSDGDTDVVITSTTSTVEELIVNSNNASFSTAYVDMTGQTYQHTYATDITIGDLNLDGYEDIITNVTNAYEGIYYHSVLSDGTTQHQNISSMSGVDIKTSDFNHDGAEDILVATSTGVTVLSSNGDFSAPSFTEIELVSGLTDIEEIQVVDIDNDKDDDLIVVTKESIHIYKNRLGFEITNIVDPTYVEMSFEGWFLQPFVSVEADFDQTFKHDMVVYGVFSNQQYDVTFELNGGSEIDDIFYDSELNFKEYIVSSSIDGLTDLISVDLDGDNDVDVIASALNGNRLSWFENNGYNTFTEHVINTSIGGIIDIELMRDGSFYTLVVASMTKGLKVFYGNEPELFSSSDSVTEDINVSSVWAGVNDNNVPSLVYYDATNHEINIYDSVDGNLVVPYIGNVTDIAVVDINNDDKVDIVFSDDINHQIGWIETDGTTHFNVIETSYPEKIDLMDINTDGNIDIVSLSSRSGTFEWHENDGNGIFTTHVIDTTNENNDMVFFYGMEYDTIDIFVASTEGIKRYNQDYKDKSYDVEQIVNSSENLSVIDRATSGRIVAGSYSDEIIYLYEYAHMYNLKVVEPYVPVREGYTFTGWYIDEELTTLYNFDTILSADITLYAGWDALTHTISFDSKGGTVVPSMQFEFNELTSAPQEPTMDNYGFLGWYTDEDLTTPYTWGTPMPNQDFTLYAAWSEFDYHVTFDSNGGTTIENGEMTDGIPLFQEHSLPLFQIQVTDTVPADVDADGYMDLVSFTNNHNTINLLHNNGDGSYTKYLVDRLDIFPSDYQVVNITRNDRLEILFVEDYQLYYYEFDEDLNVTKHSIPTYGDTVHFFDVVDYDGDGDPDILTCDNNTNTIMLIINDNYIGFEYYIVSSTLTGTLDIKGADMDNDGDTDIVVTSFTNNKIVWYENNQTYSFTEQTLISLDSPIFIDIADFDGDGSLDIVVIESLFSSKIRLYINDGSMNYTATNLPLSNTGLYNYFCDMDNDGDMDIMSFTTSVSSNQITWLEQLDDHSIVAHTATAILDNLSSARPYDYDGDGDTDIVASISSDDLVVIFENYMLTDIHVIEPTAPTKVGYTFAGWYEDEALTTLYDFNTNVTGNITLYAGWDGLPNTISFESNGGTNVEDLVFDTGDLTVKPAAPTKENHVFTGWYEDEALTIPFVWGETMPANDMTLYADWDYQTYTITFDVDDGSAVSDVVTPFGEIPNEPVDPIKAGYTFEAWYLDPELTQRYFWNTPMSNEDFTLYADWGLPSYDDIFNITYDVNGDSGSIDAQISAIPSFLTHTFTTGVNQQNNVVVVDFDNDGDLDVVISSLDNDILWYENDGFGAFTSHQLTSTYTLKYFDVLDLDGDGDVDILAIENSNNQLVWLENTQSSIFVDHAITNSLDACGIFTFADMDHDHDIDIIVSYPTLNKVSLLINDGNQNYSSSDILTNIQEPKEIELADVNLDGYIDIYVTTTSDQDIYLIVNEESVEYTPYLIIENIGSNPESMRVIDMDKDGDIDVVVSFMDDNRLVWYENQGDFSYFEHTIANVTSPQFIEVFDYDLDGDLDVVTSLRDSDNINYYANNGNQSFDLYGINQEVDQVADMSIGDVNGDGSEDIFVIDSNNQQIAWFEVKTLTDPYLVEPSVIPIKEFYTFTGWYEDEALTTLYDFNSVLTGDLTLYAGWSANEYDISFEANGGTVVEDVSFEYQEVTYAPTPPTKEFYTFTGWYTDESLTTPYVWDTEMPANDFTLYAGWTLTQYTISFETDGGSDISSYDITYEYSYNKELIGSGIDLLRQNETIDFDQDGDLDIIAKGQYVYWFENIDGKFISHKLNVDGNLRYIDIFDVDQDGYLDIAAIKDYNTVVWYENDGSFNFTSHILETGSSIFADIVCGDIDGNGATDIIVTNTTEGSITKYLNDGNQNFTSEIIKSNLDYPDHLAIGDFDLDGDLDFTYADSTSNYFTICLNQGDGTYIDQRISINMNNMYWVESGDIDNDGDIDFVISDYSSHKVSWVENTGSSEYVEHALYMNGETPFMVDMFDIDDDGDQDIVLSVIEDKIYIYRNDGSQNFQRELFADNISRPESFSIGDLNGDNQTDIIIASRYSGTLYAFKAGDKINPRLITPDEPTKDHYVFNGWYEDEALTTLYDFNSVLTGDLTLYAGWTNNLFNISFVSNGGTNVSDISFDGGDSTVEPSSPTRVGYTFAGWYTDEALATAYVWGSDMPTNDMTLYAKWTANYYQIRWLDGDENEISTIDMPFDADLSEVVIPAAPQIEGHTQGWDVILPETMPAYNLTITATYDINSYTLRFEDADGNELYTQDFVYSTSLSTLVSPEAPQIDGYTQDWDQEIPATMPANDITITATYTANPYTITWIDDQSQVIETQTFDCDADLSGVIAPDASKEGYDYVWHTTLPETMPANNLTIRAVYTINQYTITWKDADGNTLNTLTADYGTDLLTATHPVAPQVDGYTQDWDQEIPATMPANDITITATYTINQYTITWYDTEGNVLDIQTYDFDADLLDVIEPNAPQVDGYSQDWDQEIPATMPASDMTITATYTANPYTITWVDAEGNTLDTQTYDCDADLSGVIVPAAPQIDGYSQYWNQEIPATMPANDITITATYTINQYTITWVDAEGNTLDTQTYDFDADLLDVIEPNAPQVDGYTQDWDQEIPATMPASDMTITATYTANPYTITWIDDQSQVIETQTYDCDADLSGVIVPAAPQVDGYTQDWDQEIPATMPASDMTITATYTANPYTITWVDTEGNTLDTQTYDCDADLSGVIVPAAPQVDGYTQDWDQEIPATMPASDMTITATYTANPYTIIWIDDQSQVIETQTFDCDADLSGVIAPDASKEGYDYAWHTTLPETMPANNLTIKAVYTINQYTITWKDADGNTLNTLTADYGTDLLTATHPVAPQIDGYTQDWDQEIPATMPASDMTITATYTANPYTITWIDDQSQVIETQTFDCDADLSGVIAPDASKEGYDYAWHTTLPETMPANNLTIKAVYTINQYTITWKDADGNTLNTLTADYGTDLLTATHPVAPQIDGYTQDWDQEIPATMPASDMTITATYTANPYTITWIDDQSQVIETQTFDCDADLSGVIAPDASKEGYDYVWHTTLPETMPANNLTIKAVYTINQYTITWKDADGNTLNTLTADYGTDLLTATHPIAPQVDGYTQDWDQEIPATMPANHLTITAVYTPIDYTITWYDNSGNVLTSETYACDADLSDVVAPATPSVTHYHFDHWDITLPATMPANHLDITAVYAIDQYTITWHGYYNYIIVETTYVDYGTDLSDIVYPNAPHEGYTQTWEPLPETMPDHDIDMNPIYSKNTYYINYYGLNNELYAQVAYLYNDFIKQAYVVSAPIIEGYSFGGYDYDKALDFMPAHDLSIYAIYTAKSYEIEWYNNYTDELIRIDTVTYGTDLSTIEFPEIAAREGYVVDWHDILPATMPAEDIFMTVDYALAQYVLTFYDAEGDVITSYDVNYDTPLTTDDFPIVPKIDGYTQSWDQAMPATMPANNLSFHVIYTANSYTITWLDQDGQTLQSITRDCGTDLSDVTHPDAPEVTGYVQSWDQMIPETMPAYNIIIKAIYNVNPHTITWYDLDGNVLGIYTDDFESDLSGITIPIAPQISGYTQGWDQTIPATMPDHDMDITTMYTVNPYTITWKDADGNTLNTLTADYGTDLLTATHPIAPQVDGYTQDWDQAIPETMPANHLTITAVYTGVPYTMTWLDKDGEIIQENTYPYNTDLSGISSPETPIFEGYQFSVWDSEIPATMPANDVIITANYDVLTFEINWYGFSDEIIQTLTVQYGYDLSDVTHPDAPHEGYTQTWEPLPETMPDHDIDMNPIYSKNTYYINYYGLNNELYAQVAYLYNDFIKQAYVVSAPIIEGYSFGGYDYDKALDFMPAHDLSIYAIYTAKSYEIEWYNNYTDELIRIDTVTYGTDLSTIEFPEIAAREGYVVDWHDILPATMPAEDIFMTVDYALAQYVLTFYDAEGDVITSYDVNYDTPLTTDDFPIVPKIDGYTQSWDQAMPATMPANNLSFHVIYTANSYTITWLDQDGQTLQSITRDCGTDLSDVTHPDAPEVTGYVQSWDQMIPETMPAYNIIIKAIYNVNPHTITWYDLDGNVLGIYTDDFESDLSGITIPIAPQISGYTQGWDQTIPATMPDHDMDITTMYTANPYTITWVDNEGNTIDSQTYDCDADLSSVIAPEAPAIDHYVSAWDTEIPATMPANDITITATYTINQYTITWYDTEGNMIDTSSYDYGTDLSDVTHPDAPEITGYTQGWDQEIPATMPAHDITITATYTANSYTITWIDANENVMTTLTDDYGTDLTGVSHPVAPEITGYTQSWDQEIPATMPAHDVTITVIYTANPYTITWVDAEGNTLDTQTYDCDADLSGVIVPAAPQVDGYTQDWDQEIPATMPANDITITATYTINQYTITWYDTEGNVLDIQTYDFDADLSDVIEPNAPQVDGYSQDWDQEIPATMPAHDITITATYTANSYTITWIDANENVMTTLTDDYGTDLTDVSHPEASQVAGYTQSWDQEVPETMPAHDVTITVIYTANPYTITWVDAEGNTLDTQTYDCDADLSGVIVPAAPQVDGYTQDWDQEIPATMPAHNMTITVAYIINQYTITWYDTEGNVLKTLTDDYQTDLSTVTNPDASKEGYTYVWDKEIPAMIPDHDVDITTVYTPIQHTITWYDTEGEVLQVLTVDFNADLSTVSQPDVPEIEGYTQSWSRDLPLQMPNENIEITLTYLVNPYKIIWQDTEGNTLKENVYNADAEINPAFIVAPDVPEIEGYSITWDQDIPSIMPANDVFIQLVYVINTYTITWVDINGQDIDSLTDDYHTDLTGISHPAVPQIDGYTQSWDQEIPATMPANDITITVMYTANPYTITWVDADGDSVDVQTYDCDADLSDVIEPNAPQVEGYTQSWDQEIPATMPANDITITAVYTINQYTMTWVDAEGNTLDTQVKDFGADLTEITEPDASKEGYTYTWDTTIPATMPANDLTIIVIYTANAYTITWYDADGNTLDIQMYDCDADLSDVIEPNAPQVDAYMFTGWDTEIPATMPANDITVTALYRLIEDPIISASDEEVYLTDVNIWIPTFSASNHGTDIKDQVIVTYYQEDGETLLTDINAARSELEENKQVVVVLNVSINGIASEEVSMTISMIDNVKPEITVNDGLKNLLDDEATTSQKVTVNVYDITLQTITYAKDGEAFIAIENSHVFMEPGVYVIRATDSENNFTEMTFTIDPNAPRITVKSNDQELSDGCFINDTFQMIADSVCDMEIAYSFDSGAFVTLTSGVSHYESNLFEEEGYYQFKVTSQTGEVSLFSIYIDLTKPTCDHLDTYVIEYGTTTFDCLTLLSNIQDDFDTEIRQTILTNTINLQQLGTYEVVVRIEDEAGNYSDETIEVLVVDTVAPTCADFEEKTVEIYATPIDFESLLVFAEDNTGDDLNIALLSGFVDYEVLGHYTVMLRISDESGNFVDKELTVLVQDSIAPDYEIKEEFINIEIGETIYLGDYITVIDNYDGDITSRLEMADTYDLTKPGTYHVLLKVSDDHQNETIIPLTIEVKRNSAQIYVYTVISIIVVSGSLGFNWFLKKRIRNEK